MNDSRILIRSAMAVALALATGCDDGLLGLDDSEALAEGSDAFWSGVYTSAGWTGRSWLPVDIGDAATETCFLSAIGGNLQPGGPSGQEIGIFEDGGTWTLLFRLGASKSAWATAGCVNHGWWGRTAEQSVGGDGNSVVLGAVSGSRRCFLTAVGKYFPTQPQAQFNSADDKLEIVSEGGNWVLKSTGHGQGSARCINVNGDRGTWALGGPYSVDLALNDSSPPTQCFLTAVEGTFATNAFSGAGVEISYSSSPAKYVLTTTSGRGAAARCVK